MRIARFALAAALVFTAAPASAAVHLSMSGVVTQGTDNGYLTPGLQAPFGTDGASVNVVTGQTFGYISNRPFTLDIVIDTGKGQLDTFLYPGGSFSNYLYGVDDQNPARATFTLGDITYAWGGPSDTPGTGIFEKHRNGYTGEGVYGVVDGFQGRPPMEGAFTTFRADLTYFFNVLPGTFQDWDFAEPFALSQIGIGFAALNVDLQETGGTPERYILGLIRSASLDMRIDSVSLTHDTVVAPGAVPEPATWAMMILGFAAVGATLRRRRQAFLA